MGAHARATPGLGLWTNHLARQKTEVRERGQASYLGAAGTTSHGGTASPSSCCGPPGAIWKVAGEECRLGETDITGKWPLAKGAASEPLPLSLRGDPIPTLLMPPRKAAQVLRWQKRWGRGPEAASTLGSQTETVAGRSLSSFSSVLCLTGASSITCGLSFPKATYSDMVTARPNP